MPKPKHANNHNEHEQHNHGKAWLAHYRKLHSGVKVGSLVGWSVGVKGKSKMMYGEVSELKKIDEHGGVRMLVRPRLSDGSLAAEALVCPVRWAWRKFHVVKPGADKG